MCAHCYIEEGADLFVGAVDDDTNYLLAELAQERGVARTATVVDDESYAFSSYNR